MEENWDIYTRMQYREYERIAEKRILLDPHRRDIYLKNKMEREKLEKLARKYERSIRVMY